MARIEKLFNYPVAGMQGQEVSELEITTEAIVGNRIFTVVTEDQLNRWMKNPKRGTPLRMTQVAVPELTLFQAMSTESGLQIQYAGQSFDLSSSPSVEETSLAYCDNPQAFPNLQDLLVNAAIPLRVSRRSSSSRWAVDCGDEVASWISSRLGRESRLLKAVKHPESPKHHFTWYTDLHVIFSSALVGLANEVGQSLDIRAFRPNAIVDEGNDSISSAVVDGNKFSSRPCERCGYITIDPESGERKYVEVLKQVVKEHDKNFGVYLEAEETPAVVRTGQEIVFEGANAS